MAKIVPHLNQIAALVRQSDITQVVAATGGGKSVYVPLVLAASGASDGTYNIVRVTVPTRAAALGLYGYQKQIQAQIAAKKKIVPASVGYAAERDVKYDEKTDIAYVTTGHMKNRMLRMFRIYNDPSIPEELRNLVFKPCEVLLVDEIHAGTIDNDMILGLWDKAYNMRLTVPRLVIASATPPDHIAALREKPVEYKVDIPTLPIEVFFDSKDLDIEDARGTIYERAAVLAAEHNRRLRDSPGHILVFTAGKQEAEVVATKLATLVGAAAHVLILTGKSSAEEIEQVLAPSIRRKIVVSTNVAETSITIDGLAVVVDTLTEKRAETASNGGMRLVTSLISLDSALQRKGRTGRTMAGAYQVVGTRARFEGLTKHRAPEVERVPLHKEVLELLSVSLDPVEILRGAPRGKVAGSVVLLKELGLYTDQVTPKGKVCAQLTLSVRAASFAYDFAQAGYDAYAGCAIAALADGYESGYYFYPSDKDHDKHFELYFSRFEGGDKLSTICNIWQAYQTEDPGQLSRWCMKNSMNHRKLKEVAANVSDAARALKAEPVSLMAYHLAQAAAVLPASYPAYELRGKHYYLGDEADAYVAKGGNEGKRITAMATFDSGRAKMITLSADTDPFHYVTFSAKKPTWLPPPFRMRVERLNENAPASLAWVREYYRYHTFGDALAPLMQAVPADLDAAARGKDPIITPDTLKLFPEVFARLSDKAKSRIMLKYGQALLDAMPKGMVDAARDTMELDVLAAPFPFFRIEDKVATVGEFSLDYSGPLAEAAAPCLVLASLLRHAQAGDALTVNFQDTFPPHMDKVTRSTRTLGVPPQAWPRESYGNHADVDAIFGCVGPLDTDESGGTIECLALRDLTPGEVARLKRAKAFLLVKVGDKEEGLAPQLVETDQLLTVQVGTDWNDAKYSTYVTNSYEYRAR